MISKRTRVVHMAFGYKTLVGFYFGLMNEQLQTFKTLILFLMKSLCVMHEVGE